MSLASTRSPPSPCLGLRCPPARGTAILCLISGTWLSLKTPNFRDPEGGSRCTVAVCQFVPEIVQLCSNSEFMVKGSRKLAESLAALSQHPHSYISEQSSSLVPTGSFAPGVLMPPLPNAFQAGEMPLPLATQGILRPRCLLLGLYLPSHWSPPSATPAMVWTSEMSDSALHCL